MTSSDVIIKELMTTYVKYPPRKLQSESYAGPITLFITLSRPTITVSTTSPVDLADMLIMPANVRIQG